MAAFVVSGSHSPSATTSPLILTASATLRTRIVAIRAATTGAPSSDASVQVFMRFSTATGTSTAVTPRPKNGVSVAGSTAGSNCSVEPTYTAGQALANMEFNPRSFGQFMPYNPDAELCLIAATNNGVELRPRPRAAPSRRSTSTSTWSSSHQAAPMAFVQGKRNGYYLTEHLSGKLFERETFGCGHCQHVTILPHGAILDDLGRMCLKCMRPICVECSSKLAAGAACETWEERFDKIEALARGQNVEKYWRTPLEQKINAQLEREAFHRHLEENHRA